MRPPLFFVPFALLAAPSLALWGCAHHSQATRSAPPNAGAAALSDGARDGSRGGGEAATGPVASCASDIECPAEALCIDKRCVPIDSEQAGCWKVSVHFEFNSALIADGERASVDRLARCLKKDRGMHVSIAGNADERGTDEYNIALGEQRARAVEKYVEALGVSGTQMKIISYGKERPLCSEHVEACWQENRRAELRKVSGR